jgi:hypothetical protein
VNQDSSIPGAKFFAEAPSMIVDTEVGMECTKIVKDLPDNAWFCAMPLLDVWHHQNDPLKDMVDAYTKKVCTIRNLIPGCIIVPKRKVVNITVSQARLLCSAILPKQKDEEHKRKWSKHKE